MKHGIWMAALLVGATVLLNPRHTVGQVPLPEPGFDEDYGPEFPEKPQQTRTVEKRATTNEPARLGVSFDPQAFDAAIVRSVAADGPAERSGLQPGDTIEAVNGLRVRSPRDVQAIVELLRSGDVIEIDYSRRVTGSTQVVLDAQEGRGDVYPQTARERRQYADRASYEELPSPAETGEELERPAPRRIPEPRYRDTRETYGFNGRSVQPEQDDRSLDRDREQNYRGRRFFRWRRN